MNIPATRTVPAIEAHALIRDGIASGIVVDGKPYPVRAITDGPDIAFYPLATDTNVYCWFVPRADDVTVTPA